MSLARPGRYVTALIGLLLFSGVLWWTLAPQTLSSRSPRQLLDEARSALREGRHDRALEAARAIPGSEPEFADAQLVVGEILTRRREYEPALAAYEKIPEQQIDAWVVGQYCSGDLWFHLGEASLAEACYRRVLERRPDDLPTHEQLATLLGMFGRRWESLSHLDFVVRDGVLNGTPRNESLRYLGNLDAALALPPHLEKFERRAPEDPLPLLARARHALLGDRRSEAETLSRRVVRGHPEIGEGWAVLGLSLTEGSANDFYAWSAEIPPAAENFPDVWIARGLWAYSHSEHASAVRCFGEAVLRAPDSRRANYHLGQSLLLLQPPARELATPFLAHAERLAGLEAAYQVVYLEPENQEAMRRISDATESAGRYWESVGWAQLASANRRVGPAWAVQRIGRLQPRLTSDMPQRTADSLAISELRLSTYPLPAWKSSSAQSASRQSEPGSGSSLRWEDDAARAGIDFQYFNGAEPAREGKLIFQALGGGVAAVDYDGDHWPDLYFAQGSYWPAQSDLVPVIDKLYRNRGDDRFDEVTLLAGLGDRRFTHGVAVGDVDNDGFADLYLGNAGLNVLYQNCGDGTFREFAGLLSAEDERLTLSTLIADLDGDGAPELFDVSYVAVPEAWSRVCRANGMTHACSPRLMTASHDRLWWNLGDGRFENVSDAAGLGSVTGKGMGVVGLDPAGRGDLHLFVTNDTMPNLYFVNQSRNAGSPPRLENEALVAGLAFNGDGRSFACMGIAADDVDGDGLCDLFVTNFYDEPNTLYRQVAASVFEDATRQFGLYGPSLPVLGFGTQFVDADLDGWPDLVVSNGHIDDHSDRGIPYQMLPHCYRNQSGKRFELSSPRQCGSYFQQPHLGRGMARLDWNRDGADDLAISHLDEPATLLTNRAAPRGRYLAVRLVGTRASRDAHGIAVDVVAGGRKHRRQLVAGGGYVSTNESQLLFGLGEADTIESVTVHWPQGPQSFSSVRSNQHLLVIEGRRDAVGIP